MKRIRARNLSDEDIADVVALLDGWSGTLSWARLVEAIETRKFARYTRQALHRHTRIKHAFSMRKKAMAEGMGVDSVQLTSPELRAALDPLEGMLATCIDGLMGVRDRALLLFAFSSGGRRRSEVAAAMMESLINIDETTYVYRLTHSKRPDGHRAQC